MDLGAQKTALPCEHTERVHEDVDSFYHTIWHAPRKEHPEEDV